VIKVRKHRHISDSTTVHGTLTEPHQHGRQRHWNTGGRQHRTTPAGQIVGVATPATPAALTPMRTGHPKPQGGPKQLFMSLWSPVFTNFNNLSAILSASCNATCLTLIGANCALADSLVQRTTARPPMRPLPPWGPRYLGGQGCRGNGISIPIPTPYPYHGGPHPISTD